MKIIEIGSCCAGVPQIYARYFGTTQYSIQKITLIFYHTIGLYLYRLIVVG